jgi:hypothetical protein
MLFARAVRWHSFHEHGFAPTKMLGRGLRMGAVLGVSWATGGVGTMTSMTSATGAGRASRRGRTQGQWAYQHLSISAGRTAAGR